MPNDTKMPEEKQLSTSQSPSKAAQELLPCLHCQDGGKPYAIQDDAPKSKSKTGAMVSYCEVGCNGCGIHLHGVHESPAPLIAIWNTRTPEVLPELPSGWRTSFLHSPKIREHRWHIGITSGTKERRGWGNSPNAALRDAIEKIEALS